MHSLAARVSRQFMECAPGVSTPTRCSAVSACAVVLVLTLILAALGDVAVASNATSADERQLDARARSAQAIQAEMLPFVEDMLEHAIDAYLRFGFPHDELRSLSGGWADSFSGTWVTIIDSLDTVAIMGRPKLFRRLAKWVEENVNYDMDVGVSGFETNIRLVGGLISAHFMYEEGIVPVVPEEHDYSGKLLGIAVDLADRLLPAFDTETGVPYGSINLRHGVPPNETTSTATASSGTYLMEMIVLSRMTGDMKYEAAARRASHVISDLSGNKTGLLGNHIDIQTGEWRLGLSSVGTGADSTLEYWLKGHALSGEGAEWELFLRQQTKTSRYLREGGFYVQVGMNEPSNWHLLPHHDSLASFYPGCLANAGRLDEAVEALWSQHSIFKLFGVMPETFSLVSAAARTSDSYPLRPEHVESIYHLYRTTGDPAYLQMGKEFALGLYLRTFTPLGFASLEHSLFPHDREKMKDLQESFVISETLKYLYLLFDECNPIHLHARMGDSVHHPVCPQDSTYLSRSRSRTSQVGWLFTTEAHLFPNHAEWLTPAPASAMSKPLPAGLAYADGVGSASEQAHDTPLTEADRLAEHVRKSLGLQQPLSSGALPAELRARCQSEQAARLRPFLESVGEARERTLAELHETLSEEIPLRKTVRHKLRRTPRAVFEGFPRHQYYCRNQAPNGLNRLSKSVFREVVPPSKY